MRPSRENRTVVSTMTGEDVRMGLAKDAAAHLMSMLASQYGNPELAMLREYSTNAWDSHVVAGQTRPIEVELPAPLKPVLIIRDFGIGMDAEDIRKVYSQYGASTKRDTNALNGTFGIGGKAALAYTDQFTVIGVKGGIRTVVSVNRDEDGGGTMKLVSQEPTDQANGVEITIPVARGNDLEGLAAGLYRFWKPGTVLVNGKPPKHISELGGVQITDTIRAFKPTGYRVEGGLESSYIVMGNVPYEVDLGLSGLARNLRLVAEVPIGSVDIPPPRESLMDTPRTKEQLRAVVADYKANYHTAVQRAVEAAPTKALALKAWDDGRFLGQSKDVTWHGINLPTEFQANGGVYITRLATGSYSYGGEGAHVKVPGVDPTDAVGKLWITDFDNGTWTAQMRRKLNAYVAKAIEDGSLPAGTTAEKALLTPDAKVPSPDWLGSCPTISWKDVRAFKLNGGAAVGGGVSYAGTYPVTVIGKIPTDDRYKRRLAATEIDTTKPLLYRVGSSGGSYSYRNQVRTLFGVGAQLVDVSENRKAKFLRLFPTAKSYDEALRAAANAWWEKQPKDAREAAMFSLRRHTELAQIVGLGLDTSAINDPDLRGVLERAKLLDEHPGGTKLRNEIAGLGTYLTAHVVTLKYNFDLYPLLTVACQRAYNVTGEMKRHLELYVNAVYAANQEKEHE